MWQSNERLYREINEGAIKYPELYQDENDYLLKLDLINGSAIFQLYNGVPMAAEQIFKNEEAVAYLKKNYPDKLKVLEDLASVFSQRTDKTELLTKYPSYYDAISDVQTAYLQYVENVSRRFELREPLLTEDMVCEVERTAGLLSSGIKDYEHGFISCLDLMRKGELDIQLNK